MPDSFSILLQTASSTTRSGITRLTSFVGLVVLACIPLALTDNQIVQWNPVLFTTAFVLVNIFLLSHDDHGHVFFSPAAIMANYATLTFSIGAFAFSQQLVFENYGANYMLYYELDYLPLATSYFLCCVIASLLSLQLIGKKRPALSISTGMQHVRDEKGAKWIRIVLAVLALAVFSKIDFSIPIWGSGDFSILLCVISALTLAYYARKAESAWRYLLYILLFAYFVVFEIENKRIAIFFAFGLTFLELAPWKEFRINLQFLGRVLGVALAGLLAIISMSIYRGFGQYDVGSMADAVTLIPRYLESDIALTMLFHNLEGTASYFHSVQAFEAQKSIAEYSYGYTYIKSLFLVVPRSIFPDKPVSFITLYNNLMYPEFRMGGGSFLPNFYAEGYWNFGFFGVIFIVFIFVVLNYLYNKLIYDYRMRVGFGVVKYIGLYTFILFGFRGAGIDGYLSLGIIILSFGFVFQITGEIFSRLNS